MQSIIEEALKFKDSEERAPEEFKVPRIVVIGCGGAGNNTVTRLKCMGVEGAQLIAVNTDHMHLDITKADKKILIGKSLTKGLGAGGDPQIGRQAAELDRAKLEEAVSGADLVFITAGMGGGTGTGAAPVVAEIAKNAGAIVIGMVSTPFKFERARLLKAEDGLEELRKKSDTVIVLDNNKLLSYVPNVPIDDAFKAMDQIIAESIKGISETITKPSLINLDYADVRAVMSCGGVAVMLWGETNSQDRGGKARNAVRKALEHPLLDIDYHGARGCLIHVTGGGDLTIKEIEEIATLLTAEIDPKANVIWGARIDDRFEGRIRLVAIMTGVQSPQILGPNNSEQEPEYVRDFQQIIDVIR